jgi:hypothetical protein
MASTAALDLVISLKAEGAESGLKTMASHVSALGTAVGTFAGGAALAGVRALGGAITGFLGDAIQESRDAAHGLAQTEAVIKSTGGAAGVTAAQIVDMAGALSHSTLFTDDAIQADENLLLTFTNLKNGVGAGNDIFTQATKVSLDLAQAMGTDAAGGAVQLGKALNDPTAGISALTRVGVTFTDAQKGMIKSLQDSGDLMGAQKIILGELNKEFGGSAEAAAKADGGFHLFNQRLSDVKQTIGDALQPALRTMIGFMAGPGMDAIEYRVDTNSHYQRTSGAARHLDGCFNMDQRPGRSNPDTNERLGFAVYRMGANGDHGYSSSLTGHLDNRVDVGWRSSSTTLDQGE